ncbi:MAG: hypothetical protein WCA35_25340 [Kovacikia sp.]
MKYFRSLFSSQPVTRLRQGGIVALGGVAIAAGSMLANSSAVRAQAAYGSYIGLGAAVGVTSGGVGEDSETAANIAFRYKFLKVPVSARAQVLIGSGTAAVPTVSYDIPVNWRTDVYVGLGAAFNASGNTPVGNQTAFVIQPGIDYALPNSDAVLFGNAIIAFNAYRNSGGTAASLQAGFGLRF